jgi:hypothetical protein
MAGEFPSLDIKTPRTAITVAYWSCGADTIRSQVRSSRAFVISLTTGILSHEMRWLRWVPLNADR